MHARVRIFTSLVSVFFSIAGYSAATDEPVEEQATVILDYDGLFIGAPTADNLVVMEVRVFDEDNQLVFRERSLGQPVNLLAVDLPDGEYSFEIVNVLEISQEVQPGPNVETEKDVRANGEFTVYGGEVIEGRLPGGGMLTPAADEASLLHHVVRQLWWVVRVPLNALISSAHADLTVTGTPPDIFFDDDGTVGTDWGIQAQPNAHFIITDRNGSNFHSVLAIGGIAGSDANENSIWVDADGDIHWSDGSMHFIKNQGLSIWTQQVNGDITIFSGAPDIHLHDNTGTQETEWALTDNKGQFWGRPDDSANWKNIFEYDVNAPDYSMVIGANGNVGLGTNNPSKALDIRRSGGKGAINIINTSGSAAGRTLFKAKNKGALKVELKNTQDNVRWQVVNTGSGGLKFNQTKNGGNEFALKNNGDAVLGGVLTENSDVNAKRDIVPVDSEEILDRIAALPIAEWSYKDAPRERHVGPMAQDFHAAFGLGHSDRHIATLDSAGIALAGIQALVEENDLLRKENRSLLEQLEAIEAEQAQIRTLLSGLLEANSATAVPTQVALN